MVNEDLEFRIDSGTRIKYWMDHWYDPLAFNQSFSVLFEVVVNKLETVAEVWDLTVGNESWNLKFVRDFNDWE